jgi:hypothetical protein
VTVTMNEIIDNLAQAAAQPEELDVALTPVEQRAILAALKAGQAYADAYRAWHGIDQRQDCSKESMERFKKTRNAALAAYPGGES